MNPCDGMFASARANCDLLQMLQVMTISQLIRSEFDGQRDLSGIGGVETGRDAAEFLLLGANSVQAWLLSYDKYRLYVLAMACMVQCASKCCMHLCTRRTFSLQPLA